MDPPPRRREGGRDSVGLRGKDRTAVRRRHDKAKAGSRYIPLCTISRANPLAGPFSPYHCPTVPRSDSLTAAPPRPPRSYHPTLLPSYVLTRRLRRHGLTLREGPSARTAQPCVPRPHKTRRSPGSDGVPWPTPALQPLRQRSCGFVGLVAKNP